jgi:protein SCO1/2
VKRIRLAIWALVVLALAGLAYLYVRTPSAQQASEVTLAPASFGGPFSLVGADGAPFSSGRLAGKPYAIFFGFTHCPDTCPTTLARLVRLRRDAGGDDSLNIVFVTVDPGRDGPKEIGAYANAFGAPIIGLTGSPEQIQKVEKQYGIFAQKVPTGGDYTMDHTATVSLFDRNGKFVSTISPDEQDAPALDKLKRLSA